MIRSSSQATSWALTQHLNPFRNWHNDCLMFVRMCLNVAARYPSAEKGYYATQHRHTSWPPPAGVPVWWTNGRYGHVAISAGNGLCWSNDYLRSGHIDKVRIGSITAGWGAHYRGWSEDINGVRVYKAATPGTGKPGSPILDASVIEHATRHHASIYWGVTLKKAVAKEVGRGEMNLANGILGDGFRTQYKKVQHKFVGPDATAKDADGIPGIKSLKWLGKRHGFVVKA